MDENEQNQQDTPTRESDAAYQQRVANERAAETNRDAFGLAPVTPVDDADQAQAKFAADLAAQQDAAAKAGTTAHPSGLPAQAAFGQRMQDAMFRLRNHGYDEVTSLLDDLYAGVQRVEATARGETDEPAEG